MAEEPELGAVSRECFERHLGPRPGADREDVVLGPRHGLGFGVLELGGKVVAVGASPLFVPPEVGLERAGRFAVDRLLTDVAVSGVPPTHLSVDCNLPPEMTDGQFETVWTAIHGVAESLGVRVVSGHTARYDGCAYPMVGGGTAFAVGDTDRLVRPDGARVGDRVVVTKGPAVAAAGLLTRQFETRAREGMDATALEAARELIDDAAAVRDALVAAAAGPVTAMCAPGDRGLLGGLCELAHASDVGFDVDRAAMPVLPGVREACACFGVDPWTALADGALVATVPPENVERVLAALETEGVEAATVGSVVEATDAGTGPELRVDGEAVSYPRSDPYWRVVASDRRGIVD